MRILLVCALLCAATAFAQTVPGTPATPGQPGSPAQPTSQPTGAMPEPGDPTNPTSVAPAPPIFVPGTVNRGPVRISGGVMAGNVLSKVNPVYPPDAKRAGLQGSVVMAATISKAGTVSNLKVVSGPPALAAAAMDAVRQWTYRPYLLNGQPIEVLTTVTVNFNLSSPAAESPQ